jgi:hypothetical protein
MAHPAERILCLAKATAEALHLLGGEHRIAGASGYAWPRPQTLREAA